MVTVRAEDPDARDVKVVDDVRSFSTRRAAPKRGRVALNELSGNFFCSLDQDFRIDGGFEL